MDEQMQAGEQNEDAELQKILELCKSNDPSALQQIASIVTGMLSNQGEEEKEIQGGDGKDANHEAMIQAVKNQMAE